MKDRMGVMQYEKVSCIHVLNHSFKYLLTSYEGAKQGCLLKEGNKLGLGWRAVEQRTSVVVEHRSHQTVSGPWQRSAGQRKLEKGEEVCCGEQGTGSEQWPKESPGMEEEPQWKIYQKREKAPHGQITFHSWIWSQSCLFHLSKNTRSPKKKVNRKWDGPDPWFLAE